MLYLRASYVNSNVSMPDATPQIGLMVGRIMPKTPLLVSMQQSGVRLALKTDALMCTDLSHEQSYLIDLMITNGNGKDGESMCNAFRTMINITKSRYGCIVVCFCCDNDGGSQARQKMLIAACPWLFGPPCMSHQVYCQSYPSLA